MANEDDIVQNFTINVNENEADEAFKNLKNSAQSAFDSLRDIFEKGDFKAFESLKDSGTEAFKSLQDSAGHAFDAVKAAGGGAADELKAAFSSLGISSTAVFVGLGAAAVAFGTALYKVATSAYGLVEAQSKVVNSLADLSDKTHTSIQTVSELETAYAHAGVSAGEFASGFSKLSDTVEKTWAKIKKDTESGADALESKTLSAQRAMLALSKIESERKDALINNDLPNANKPVDPFKGDLVTAEATQKAIEKELELKQARLAAREAERAENEAQRNDLSQVTKGVQALIDGNKEALKGFNASSENIIKGVVAAAGQGTDALKKLGENFATVGSKAPETAQVLQVLGNTLKQIEDPALRDKIALEALGKSGASFLSALDSGKLDEFISRVKSAGSAIDETDKKIASDFKNAITGLNQDLENISSKVASAFGPGITDAIKSFDEFLVRNETQIKRVAEAISSVLTPAIKAASDTFISAGESISGLVDLLRKLGQVIEAIGKGDFSKVKQSLKELYETAKAYDQATSTNAEEQKKGRDKLSELRKKDFDDEKKQEEEQKRKAEDKKVSGLKSPSQEEWDKLSEDQKQDFLKKSRAAAGVDSSGTKIGPAKAESSDATPFTGSAVKNALDFPSIGDTTANIVKKLIEFGAGGKPVDTGIPELFQRTPGKRSELGDQQPFQTSSLLDELIKKSNEPTKADTGIGESIKNSLQPLLDSIHTLGEKPGDKTITDPAGVGIRGAAEETNKLADAAEKTVSPLDQLKTSVEGLKTAVDSAAKVLAEVKSPSNDNTDTSSSAEVAAADGGHIRGPGTSTSDSIPAMLSDGEFVVKKSAVDRIGLDTLYAINEERLHFAQGGTVRKKRPDGRIEEVTTGASGNILQKTTYDSEADLPENQKSKTETYRRQKSGLDVNGNTPEQAKFFGTPQERATGTSPEAFAIRDRSYGLPPGTSQAEFDGTIGEKDKGADKEGPYTAVINNANQAVIDSINEASQAEGESDPNFIPIIYQNKKRRHAEGGLITAIADAFKGFSMPHFAKGGHVSLNPSLPRISDGGSISLAPRLPRFADGGAVAANSGGSADMPHLGTVDLSTNYGNVRVAASKATLSDLRRAAVQRNVGSSPKPSWVG